MNFKKALEQVATKWSAKIARKRKLFAQAALDAAAVDLGQHIGTAGERTNEQLSAKNIKIRAKII